jgi:hypothetical protein
MRGATPGKDEVAGSIPAVSTIGSKCKPRPRKQGSGFVL